MSVEQRGKRLANRRPMLSKYVDEMESEGGRAKRIPRASLFFEVVIRTDIHS